MGLPFNQRKLAKSIDYFEMDLLLIVKVQASSFEICQSGIDSLKR